MSGVMAGGQDWLAIWRRMYESERAQGEAATDPEFGRDADPWAGRAGRFAAASQRQPQPDSFMRALLPQLRPTDTVLDIGAGTGRYLPTLAASVREVIAIEPSAAMRVELERVIADAGLPNVTVLAEQWPPARPVVGDVLISAHVVYALAEVGPFFLAMDGAARRACHLYLGIQHPGYALAAFWERVHGERRLPLPAALEALACLHQLGIYAGLELVPIPGSFRFANMGEALDEIRHRMRLTPRPDRDARIVAAAADLLTSRDDGWLALRDQPTHAALMSWKTVRREV
ncbi:MAG: class I SAM-dependent methyltransferase [Chloroflexales bacterium]